MSDQGMRTPALWSVPREWPGERCFIIGGGESVRAQRHLVPKLKGRVIAIKEAVLLRPNADVLLLGGESSDTIAAPLVPLFTGRYLVVRSKLPSSLPERTLRIGRTKVHTALCEDPRHVAGLDCGTSAINIAYHFGAVEIILLGYDMTGNRWFNGEWPHPEPSIPLSNHRRHLGPLAAFAADARSKGIRIVNTSPITKAKCFEQQPLEAFL